MNKAKALMISTRPWSFPMTLGSVLVGTLLAAKIGDFFLPRLILVAIGTILAHSATNLLNDYFDFKSGLDKPGSPTAKYRRHPLVEDWFNPRELIVYSSIAYFFVLVIGAYLTYLSGPLVIGFGLIGFVAGYFYTGGIKYKYLGWGEVSVFIVWGPLMVTGSFFVQSETITITPVLVSIPLGLLVSSVLLGNNLRDKHYDKEAGVKTVATLVDETNGFLIFTLLISGAYLSLIFLILAGILTFWSMLVFSSLPVAYQLLQRFTQEVPDDADARTGQLEIIFAGLLAISLIVDTLV
ncbi:1,4-dihydroxy-2-naphthoate octaprenyltransferase [Candidatus Bipolaricaulota bacterium]|nr:1,4-dihydroxy-2-naphthoate octaprenyltransferase [Candidatus Bipolaricaulota bacterium]